MSEAEAAEREAAYIARLLADAPPPTPRQVEIVRGLLGDTASRRQQNTGRRAA